MLAHDLRHDAEAITQAPRHLARLAGQPHPGVLAFDLLRRGGLVRIGRATNHIGNAAGLVQAGFLACQQGLQLAYNRDLLLQRKRRNDLVEVRQVGRCQPFRQVRHREIRTIVRRSQAAKLAKLRIVEPRHLDLRGDGVDARDQPVDIGVRRCEHRMIRHRHQLARLDVRKHGARTREKVRQHQLIVAHLQRLAEVPADDVYLAVDAVPNLGDAVVVRVLVRPGLFIILGADSLRVGILAELLLDLALGQVVVSGDPIHVLPVLARLPVKALPRHLLQQGALVSNHVGHQTRRNLLLGDLGLVLDPRRTQPRDQEVLDHPIRVAMQRRGVDGEAQPTLDQLRGLLGCLPLRALNLKATAHVRRGSLGVQARLQRVDRAEEHVEQVLAAVLPVVKELTVSRLSLVAPRLVRLFLFLDLADPMLNEVAGFLSHYQLGLLVGFIMSDTRIGAFIIAPTSGSGARAGIAPHTLSMCRPNRLHASTASSYLPSGNLSI